ncbi:MAG: dethiobiotin synthase [Peptococcaceae bacterium]|nr:dethiobiotin synthase [Peptococcaceae bacterium]
MGQGLFLVGTGAGVGKTTVATALIKAVSEAGYDAAYYKPVIMGSDSIPESDAGTVRTACGLEQPLLSLASHLFKAEGAPYLAAEEMHETIDLELLEADYAQVALLHDATIVEGLGGIFSLWQRTPQVLQEDLIKRLAIETLVVADARADASALVLTLSYLHSRALPVAGVVLNFYDAADASHHALVDIVRDFGASQVVATMAEGGTLEVRAPFFLLND